VIRFEQIHGKIHY